MSACGAEPVVLDTVLDLPATVLHAGAAEGELLVLDEPLSFWGGSDLETGRIADEHHPQRGALMAGRVLALRSGRGSSSSSSVLAEQIRSGVAPAALLLAERDAVLVLGALVAAELYGLQLPVLLLHAADHARLPRSGTARVTAGAAGAAAGGATGRVLVDLPSDGLRGAP